LHLLLLSWVVEALLLAIAARTAFPGVNCIHLSHPLYPSLLVLRAAVAAAPLHHCGSFCAHCRVVCTLTQRPYCLEFLCGVICTLGGRASFGCWSSPCSCYTQCPVFCQCGIRSRRASRLQWCTHTTLQLWSCVHRCYRLSLVDFRGWFVGCWCWGMLCKYCRCQPIIPCTCTRLAAGMLYSLKCLWWTLACVSERLCVTQLAPVYHAWLKALCWCAPCVCLRADQRPSPWLWRPAYS